jgi:hypothetical protein
MDRREINQKWYEHFSEKTMLFTVEIDGEELEIPAKYEVCGTCNGKGSHVNPSIDSNGITPEEFAEDPGFQEDYFAGVFDQSCNECHGARVSPEVNWEALNEETKQLVEEHIRGHFDYQYEMAMERKMGY